MPGGDWVTCGWGLTVTFDLLRRPRASGVPWPLAYALGRGRFFFLLLFCLLGGLLLRIFGLMG